ncbi:MAG: dihydroxyacetone kinase subunit L [Brucellaceae bacterium]|nr:dihydroxyacetone kinase subunit L [Notoacmeibacter sp.]MCC0027448.1 dihydroxyacetone kinase subunit L [Brucellaceae bacterium]MCC0039383.1 dihydroxyacetone kinase subunit L [Brucellaceae bacterium]
MKGYTSEDFIALFEAIAGRIEREKDHLCALDGLIGDADHGIAMAQGFNAASAAVSALDPASKMPADIFNAAASAFLNAVGASSGPLYATAMMRAGAALKGKQTASDEDVAAALQAMAKGIEDRGKAVVGEKTMVDAWRPAADALGKAREAGKALPECLADAADAAEKGAAATADMVAGKGRSSRLGERARGHVDPGAASAAIIIRVMSDVWSGRSAD